MVTVIQNGCNITVTGHAESGELGVCKMLSALCITLSKSLKSLTEADFTASEGYGEYILTFNEEPQADAQLLVGSFLVGVKEMIKDFPEYIELTEH